MFTSITRICTLLLILSAISAFSQSNEEFQSCDASSVCLPLKSCPILRTQRGRSNPPKTCGSTQRRRRQALFCCPKPMTMKSEVAPETEGRAPPRSPAISSDVNLSGCGIPTTSGQAPFIMGGRIADPGNWPWMVAITTDSDNQQVPCCTGFLVTLRHVISAAHCFLDPEDSSRYQTRIGNVDQRESQMYPIQSIRNHEGYVYGQNYNDISIITLARPVNEPGVNIICLPENSLARRNLTGMGTTVAGWGSEESDGQLSNVLHYLNGMQVISTEECNHIYKTRMPNFNSNFPRGITFDILCAGYMEGGRDACGGDSGGPLMFQYRGVWYAVGIVSFGRGCGEPGFVGGFTRVTSYLDWIRQNIQN